MENPNIHSLQLSFAFKKKKLQFNVKKIHSNLLSSCVGKNKSRIAINYCQYKHLKNIYI